MCIQCSTATVSQKIIQQIQPNIVPALSTQCPCSLQWMDTNVHRTNIIIMYSTVQCTQHLQKS